MKIRGKNFFVDTSAFIVFLHGSCNAITKEIFKNALEGNSQLVTSSRCIDELLLRKWCCWLKLNTVLETKR